MRDNMRVVDEHEPFENFDVQLLPEGIRGKSNQQGIEIVQY